MAEVTSEVIKNIKFKFKNPLLLYGFNAPRNMLVLVTLRRNSVCDAILHCTSELVRFWMQYHRIAGFGFLFTAQPITIDTSSIHNIVIYILNAVQCCYFTYVMCYRFNVQRNALILLFLGKAKKHFYLFTA